MVDIRIHPYEGEMLSQNDFFTKTILGPVKTTELGLLLSHEKSNVAYRYGVICLKRRDWLADTIRGDIAEHLDLPPEFLNHDDRIERLTRPKFGVVSLGFWLAALTLLMGIGIVAFAST